MDNKTALTDRLWLGIGRAYKNNKTPFLAALFTGLLAHGFAFTNKLLNHDEIESLFGKGATVTSGRWGLELVKLLFPDWSMPWIYGIISVVLLAVSVCRRRSPFRCAPRRCSAVRPSGRAHTPSPA